MKNILHLFKRDVQNVSRSVIGLAMDAVGDGAVERSAQNARSA